MCNVYSNFATPLWLLQKLKKFCDSTTIHNILAAVPCTFADGDNCREFRVTKQSQISGMLTESQF